MSMEFPKKRSEFRDWQNEMNAKVHQYLNERKAVESERQSIDFQAYLKFQTQKASTDN